MISQALYRCICEFLTDDVHIEIISDELQHFCRPYVFVIHRPSGCGFYLDRNYQHIIDVSKVVAPTKCTEIKEDLLCAGNNIPLWALAEKHTEFTTHWLY